MKLWVFGEPVTPVSGLSSAGAKLSEARSVVKLATENIEKKKELSKLVLSQKWSRLEYLSEISSLIENAGEDIKAHRASHGIVSIAG